MDIVNDPKYEGLTSEQLLSMVEEGSASLALIVDRVTISQPEQPILVVDLQDEPGRTFRVIPTALWGVENNLSIGNMGFEEFADAAGKDGIFRGFEG